MTKTKYYLPNEQQQNAIDAILEVVKDYDRLYTEDGDYNYQGQADNAIGELISTGVHSTYGSPRPVLWTKRELKAIYKLAYRLSMRDNIATQTDEVTMLEAANTVFSLHDHGDALTKTEYYKYKWRNKFKRFWYKAKKRLYRGYRI